MRRYLAEGIGTFALASLGPAVVAGQLSALWLYLSAPLVGAGVGLLGCRCVREPGCCSGRPL